MSSRARRRTATACVLVAVGLILVVAGSGSGLPSYRPGLAQGAATCGSSVTTVCVQPASQVVDAGTPFTVDVVVDNVTNLGAYQFTLSFDASVISFLGGGNTSFLGSSGRDVSCLGPTASGGSVSMSCVTTSPTGPPGPQGPSGSGALASLQFSGAVPGSSPLDLSEVILTDIAANPTFAGTQDGAVTIVEGPTATPCPGGVCPTPTATPTPTPTATPSGGPTTVRIDPPSQTQPEGATFSVFVVVDNVVNLGSYQFTLAFDNLQLEFMSVNNGAFLGSTGRTVFCPSPIVGEDTVSVGCVSSSEAPPGPTGSGVLAEISFRAVSGALAPTPTLLDLFNVELSDPLANDIPAVVQDGTVTVQAPTPTPCPDGVCPPPPHQRLGLRPQRVPHPTLSRALRAPARTSA